MSAAVVWSADGNTGTDAAGRVYRVGRHGAGRSHWDAALPNGGIATVTSKKAAQEACENFATTFPPQLLEHGQENLTRELTSETGDQSIYTQLVELALKIDSDDPAPRSTSSGYSYSERTTGSEQEHALKVIRGLAAIRRSVEEAIRIEVEQARKNTTGSNWRDNSATWDVIGLALGVTKQSARSRYLDRGE